MHYLRHFGTDAFLGDVRDFITYEDRGESLFDGVCLDLWVRSG